MFGFLRITNQVKAHSKQWFQELGINFEEWEEQVWKRLKEHCEVSGYYQLAEVFNYSDWEKKWKEIKDLTTKEDYFAELKPFMNQENSKIFSNIKFFYQETERIFPEKIIGGEADEEEKKHAERYHFIVEDIWGRLNEAKQKMEQSKIETIPTVPLSLTLTSRLIIE